MKSVVSFSGVTVAVLSKVKRSSWVRFSTSPSSSPCKHAQLLQSCPTLCNPMDCSLPGSSVHRILQVTILEWVAISHRCSFFSWVEFSCSVLSNSLWPHGLQHARLPCPSPTPGVCSNSCPSSRWCHPTISSSVVPFSSCLQSFPASGSLPINQFFSSGDQSIRVSASVSVLPMNIQDWFPLGWIDWISL